MRMPSSGLPIVHVTAAIDIGPPGECFLNLAAMTTARVTSAGDPLELDLTMLATTGYGRPQAQRVTVAGEDALKVYAVLGGLAGEAPSEGRPR